MSAGCNKRVEARRRSSREGVTVLRYLVSPGASSGRTERVKKDRWPECRCAGGAGLRLIDIS